MPRDYAALAREGYGMNAIVYRSARLIAESVGSVSYALYEGEAELTAHPLLDLVVRPNPRQDGATFLEGVASHLLLAGNAYIEAVGVDGEHDGNAVRELYALRPDRMKVVRSAFGDFNRGYLVVDRAIGHRPIFITCPQARTALQTAPGGTSIFRSIWTSAAPARSIWAM